MKKLFFVIAIMISTLVCISAQSNQNVNSPIVQDIQSQVGNGTKINVFWVLPKNPKPAITKLLLYRNTRPITSYEQIKSLKPIAELSPETTGYTDSVKDFNDYFYCVISYTNKACELVFISMNTTVSGVHLTPVVVTPPKVQKVEPEKLYENDQLRETPLPYIDYVEGLNTDHQISEDTVSSTSQFSSKKYGQGQTVNPYFFEEDLISPDGGDDYLLFDILKNTFVQEKYEESIVELKKLTDRNISESVQKRAVFYMGEAQFFTGDYAAAVRSFLHVAQDYPLESKKWINYSLDNMSVK